MSSISARSPLVASGMLVGSRPTGGSWFLAPGTGSEVEQVEAMLLGTGLVDESALGRIVVEGDTASATVEATGLSVADTIGAGRQNASYETYRLRSDQVLVISNSGDPNVLSRGLQSAADSADSLVTVTDMSHGLFQLRLVGPQSADLLSRLCGLDFHPTQFGNAQARQSSVAKIHQIVVRHDIMLSAQDHASLSYSLLGGRSLARYLWKALEEAGHDLKVSPVGWELYQLQLVVD